MEIIINGIKYNIGDCFKTLGIRNDNIVKNDKEIFDIYGNYSFPTDLQNDEINEAIGNIDKLMIPSFENNKKIDK